MVIKEATQDTVQRLAIIWQNIGVRSKKSSPSSFAEKYHIQLQLYLSLYRTVIGPTEFLLGR